MNPLYQQSPLNTTIVIIVILSLLLLIFSPTITAQFYKLLRAAYRQYVFYCTKAFTQNQSIQAVYLYDTQVDPFGVELVMQESEKMISAVNDYFDFEPPTKVPVVIYPTMETLNESFGWEGDRSPMGVYWMGVIKILAPEAWIPEEGALRKFIFESMGPMAHEYTHLVVDYKTHGNYPRWFSEGVAQYVEQTLECYTTDEPSINEKKMIYPFEDLATQFDEKSNQELAYWQSLMGVQYLVDYYSQDVILNILARLGTGRRFDRVLEDITGLTMPEYTANVQQYVLGSLAS